MSKHNASCQCGALRVVASADPDISVVCNCQACQKRTGSAFATVAYIPRSAVRIEGERRKWARQADSGRDLECNFCPECGTTVFWTLDFRPDHVGVLIGAFDEEKPVPVRVVWTEEKCGWVQFPDEMEQLPKGSPNPNPGD